VTSKTEKKKEEEIIITCKWMLMGGGGGGQKRQTRATGLIPQTLQFLSLGGVESNCDSHKIHPTQGEISTSGHQHIQCYTGRAHILTAS